MPFAPNPARGAYAPQGFVDDHAALTNLASAVLVIDDGGVVTFANLEARRIFRCGPRPGMPLISVFEPTVASGAFEIARDAAPAYEGRLRLDDGQAIVASARALPNGGRAIVFHPAACEQGAKDNPDSVMGMAGRDKLTQALAEAIKEGRSPVLHAIRLSRFRHVTDVLGHGIGEALMQRVAERLLRLPGDLDLVARVGEVDFLLLRTNPTDHAETLALAERILDLLGRTYAIDGQMLNVAAHVGIAMPCPEATTPDQYVQRANLALAQARSEGDGICFYEPALGQRVTMRRDMELGLRRALALKQLELFYQPQVDLGSGRIVGFEALLRWRREDGVFVSPADFIPIAEETGLIVPIGEWVVRTACEAAARWPHPAVVAVNLSPVQFRSHKLAQSVVSALAHAGLPADRLELEITEGALLDDTEAVISTLKGLRDLGVKVSMDDFGTGYSSLSYLRKFPFDKIKIDQSFVREVEHDEDARAIVKTIAALGSSLGMKITAEGVETEGQLSLIRSHGCDYVQGYLTGRPMENEAAIARLSRKEGEIAP